jgi:hypothetical protein
MQEMHGRYRAVGEDQLWSVKEKTRQTMQDWLRIIEELVDCLVLQQPLYTLS